MGRGYSLEALRAKILFAKGAHKHINSRPKFGRKDRDQRETIKVLLEWDRTAIMDKPSSGLRLLSDLDISPPPLKVAEPHTDEKVEKNYGVDISTLARMIEDGEI